MLRNDDIVLFQGDSITDCGRNRELPGPNTPESLGRGYTYFSSARLLERYPGGSLQCFNRGIGGNRITDLADRWKADCLDLRPTVVSILIGANDTWHGIAKGAEQGVPVDRYAAIYEKLIVDTTTLLPGVRLVLCEPAVMRCGAVTEAWFPEFDQRREVVKNLAAKHKCVFVEFQRAFNDALSRAPGTYWTHDGVHPSIAGHMVMADAWIGTVTAASR